MWISLGHFHWDFVRLVTVLATAHLNVLSEAFGKNIMSVVDYKTTQIPSCWLR